MRAQCLALDELLALGAEPNALTTPQVVTSRLTSEWTYNGPTAGSREVFWTLAPAEGSAVPAARLSMRAQRPGQDVVLKTTQANCVRQLRSELKSRKLTAQPVTCPNCEAMRYQDSDFEVTIYSGMKGDYPLIVVAHQVPAPPAAPPAGLSASTAGTGALAALPPMPAVDVATAIKLLTDPQVTVLDVRTPDEYTAGHLNAAQNLSFRAADFVQQLDKLNPQGRYVLYCASGNRSGQAAALMRQHGIANVTNAGEYEALKAAGAK
ncbi:rhodanese-like domain-containing protein [Hymenobacter terrenus]|uniref:rhodanese-like domain-containing protein n=1 Tax=Hymenobacter terrenus TaxID=1629124 RepID=UPI0018CD893A|nr:rhodanese-like domain-containing protein [Hymenobacter terrenus]